jgi:putative hydrolase of the HAD superfamily
VWFFDLDDTLHDASHALLHRIDARMTDYVSRHLGVDTESADAVRRDYWRRYGATMLGLIRHHAVDPHHFLRETHDLDIPALLRAERGLARLLARLPGRKVLLTNAPAAYAEVVLRGIALHRQLPARYTIERMRVFGSFRPKPSASLLRHLLARERVPAHRAVLVEDNRANLKSARAVGMLGVLVTQGTRSARNRRGNGRPAFAGLRVRSVLDLPRRLASLRK